MRTSVKKNYIYNLVYQILILITPLVTTPYVSRVLGENGIGAVSYTQSIVIYFILFGTVGTTMYGQREIAYIQDDKKKQSQLFFEITIFRTLTVTTSLIIFFLTFARKGDYALLYRIQILDILAAALDVAWFFQGLEDFKKTVLRNTFIKICGIVLIFTFVKGPEDYPIYLFCYSITNFLGNLSLWFYLPKYLQKAPITLKGILRHLGPTFALFIPQVAVQIYSFMDKTMIGIISNHNNAENAYYEQSQKIVKMSLALVTSMGTVMVPRISNIYAQKNKEELNRNMNNTFRFVWFLATPMAIGLFTIASDLVPWFFGPGFDKVTPLIRVFSPLPLAIGFNTVFGTQYLIATMQQKRYTISVVAGAFINFILNIFLIPMFLSIGAAAASVVAETCILLIQMYFVKNELDLTSMIKMAWKYLLASAIMGGIVYYIGYYMPPAIYTTCIQIAAGGLSYAACLYILKDRFIIELIRRVLHR